MQILMVFIACIWMLRRNDELPLLITTALFYVASYRYWSVTNGLSDWVIARQIGLTSIQDYEAQEALHFIVLGEITLILTYMFFQYKKIPLWLVGEKKNSLSFIMDAKILLISGGSLIVFLAFLYKRHYAGAYGTGYAALFPLAVIGILTLIYWFYKGGALYRTWMKISALVLTLIIFNFTFGYSGRFQFVGWLAAAGLILFSDKNPKKRIVYLAVMGFLVIGLFSLAGALREIRNTEQDKNQLAIERIEEATDANMLDGFVIVRKVYPELIDYRYGMEHFEIFLRPIPRTWWPDKPVGGFVNKLGLYRSRGKGTLGFSPTLFGSFYEEGGPIGIILFSFIYAVIFAWIIRYSTKLYIHYGVLIRAIVVTSIIPLLRGGDLPGIYAWIGMAFWPCFIYLWINRKKLRIKTITKQNKKTSYQQSIISIKP